jgi:HSP20 family protein
MADEKNVQHQEVQVRNPEGTRHVQQFLPETDIFERDDSIVVVADMPGVNEKSVDINVEKNVLTITGHVEEPRIEGKELTYCEYEVGDYKRTFALSDEIDVDKIEAVLKNGVLRLVLPKAAGSRTRKVEVKAG